ncbi:hypothetical protein KIL84_014094 [Mauremys mutica]|uniref:Uncharacterized protein n=1 Tax=Mauremys mutica TaxID=74926 RepID=A0A9D4B6W1_9SAUR|nr:hypothetical protein KIL84_014094 [Mauremys mutica]
MLCVVMLGMGGEAQWMGLVTLRNGRRFRGQQAASLKGGGSLSDAVPSSPWIGSHLGGSVLPRDEAMGYQTWCPSDTVPRGAGESPLVLWQWWGRRPGLGVCYGQQWLYRRHTLAFC